MDEIQVVSTKILCLSSTRQIRPRPKTSTHGAQVSVGFNCAMSLKATRANRILGTTLDGIGGDCDDDGAGAVDEEKDEDDHTECQSGVLNLVEDFPAVFFGICHGPQALQ